jgi:hypothetical protein
VVNTNQELHLAEQEQLKSILFVRKIVRGTMVGLWGVLSWPFRKIKGWKKHKAKGDSNC